MLSDTILRATVGVLIVIVLGLGVAFAVVTSRLSGDVKDAKAEAAQASSGARKALALKPPDPEVRATDLDTVKSSVEGVASNVGALKARMQRFNDCLSEVQTEINSLDWNNDGGYIEITQQLSRPCSKLIYGAPSGD